jgi:hypothetical protein
MLFPTRVNGIPCQVQVTHFTPVTPARTWGPPEQCYPAEGGELEFEILDRRGRHAPWLERYLDDKTIDRINEEHYIMRQGEIFSRYPEPDF